MSRRRRLLLADSLFVYALLAGAWPAPKGRRVRGGVLWKHRLSVALTVSPHLTFSQKRQTTVLSKQRGVVQTLASPIRHLNHRFNEHSLPPNTLSFFCSPPLAEPALRHTPMLATQHVFSVERTRSQSSLGVFAESWGPGNLPGCVKVSMRKASGCLQKHCRCMEILRKVRMPSFWCIREGRKTGGLTTTLSSARGNKASDA